MNPRIGITAASTSDICEFAAELGWDALGPESWRVNGLQAVVAWRPIDDEFGAFVVQGDDADVLLQDIGAGFDLLDDVDVLTEIAAAKTPEDLSAWARCLGVFAVGPLQTSVMNVLGGLMASPEQQFASAAIDGLGDATWPELLPLLDEAAGRWPDLASACDRVCAHIRKSSLAQ